MFLFRSFFSHICLFLKFRNLNTTAFHIGKYFWLKRENTKELARFHIHSFHINYQNQKQFLFVYYNFCKTILSYPDYIKLKWDQEAPESPTLFTIFYTKLNNDFADYVKINQTQKHATIFVYRIALLHTNIWVYTTIRLMVFFSVSEHFVCIIESNHRTNTNDQVLAI